MIYIGMTAINPLTGRVIKINGPTYKKLLKNNIIKFDKTKDDFNMSKTLGINDDICNYIMSYLFLRNLKILRLVFKNDKYTYEHLCIINSYNVFNYFVLPRVILGSRNYEIPSYINELHINNFNKIDCNKLGNLTSLNILEINDDYSIFDNLPKLNILKIRKNKKLLDFVKIFNKLPNLTDLNYDYTSYSQDNFKNITSDKLVKLTCLRFDVTHLPNFPNLTYLKCNSIETNFVCYTKFVNLTTFKVLNKYIDSVGYNNYMSEVYRFLHYVPNLTKLTIYFNYSNNSNININGFINLHNLTHLSCANDIHISNEVLMNFPNLLKLKTAKTNIYITNEALQYFPNLTYLKCSSKMSNEGLKFVPNLKYLCCNNKITNEGLKFVPNLTHLYCSNKILNEGLKFVPNLKYLNCSSFITSDCLEYLPKLISLNIVSIRDNYDFIKSIPNIIYLHINALCMRKIKESCKIYNYTPDESIQIEKEKELLESDSLIKLHVMYSADFKTKKHPLVSIISK
jgi:hypothetical protein